MENVPLTNRQRLFVSVALIFLAVVTFFVARSERRDNEDCKSAGGTRVDGHCLDAKEIILPLRK